MNFYLLLLILAPLPLILYLIRRWWRRTQIPPQDLYICLDGHLVRSRGEWMIDAALQYLGIAHEYEPSLHFGMQTIHPDFSVGHDIFIEYWGMATRLYLQHKKEKQRLYQTRNYHLINIENAHLKNLLFHLTKALESYPSYFPRLQQTLQLKEA